MSSDNFSTYQSPFSIRYGSDKMRQIFSEENKFLIWRRIWVELATAQHNLGLVSKKELLDLKKNQNNLDIKRIHEIEKELQHEEVSAIKEFAEKAKVGGGKIHLGATSMDIHDNADTLRTKQALEIIEISLKKLLKDFSLQIEKYADLACMGYTHLQPAEPTTLGYRLAFYAQDLLMDLEYLNFVKTNLKSKGIKGAVGTSASYIKLLDTKSAHLMEQQIMSNLGIQAVDISNQTTPRKMEVMVANLLVGIAQSLYKFSFDVRIMQSPGFGEWQEPFSKTQVGSSAMPFKKNPWKSEQICSLARLIFSLSQVSIQNASLTLLERTLDDSANRRVVLPEIFLATDEILLTAQKIISGLLIHEPQIKGNLDKYGPFSATEEIMVEAVKAGADRQQIHEVLRELSMKAWEDVQASQKNPMAEWLLENQYLNKYLAKEKITQMMDIKNHLGNAPQKALQMSKQILKTLK